MDQGLGGGKGEAEDAGDLLVGKLILAAQQHGQALFFGQVVKGLLDFGLQFGVQKGLGRSECVLVFKLPRHRLVAVRLVGFDGLRGMAGAAADFVQANMPGDGKNPGREFGGNFVAGGGLVNADKNGLGQILRLGQIVQHAEHEVDDGLFIFFDQLLESAHVSRLGKEHERGIRVGWIGHPCHSKATPRGKQGCGRAAFSIPPPPTCFFPVPA